MKHNDGLDTLAAVLLLLVAVVAMIAPVALLAPVALILPAVVVLIALGILLIARRRLRAYLAAHLCSTDFENSRIQYSLTGLPIPTMLVADGRILWYNNYFRDKVLEGSDVVTRPVGRRLLRRGRLRPPRAGPDGRKTPFHGLFRLCQGQPWRQHRLPGGRYLLQRNAGRIHRESPRLPDYRY